jgi:hypothetical protein
MAEKKRVFKSEVMALPPFKAVLGEIPSPDPVRRKSPRQAEGEMHTTIHKLIGYLKEDQGRDGYL